ncbi:hypothetical protein J6590_026870 [Homalodisca vitripennis]|nr:hypothetical protein J6590_026870 [Homalodisca vitripennis]
MGRQVQVTDCTAIATAPETGDTRLGLQHEDVSQKWQDKLNCDLEDIYILEAGISLASPSGCGGRHDIEKETNDCWWGSLFTTATGYSSTVR